MPYQSKLDRARRDASGALADIHNAAHGLYVMARNRPQYGSSYFIGPRLYNADELWQIILEATTFLMPEPDDITEAS